MKLYKQSVIILLQASKGVFLVQTALDLIAQADDSQLQTLFTAIYNRYRIIRPDLEISVLFLDKKANRNDQLNRTIALLEKMKTSSV